MRIEAVDFFYLAMPEVTDEADGSQDALLVRVAARRACRLGRMRGARRCPRSPPSSARCRTACAGRSATRCSGEPLRRSRRHRAHRGGRSPTTAWTCCRPRTPGRASRWRCGTCSAGARRAGVEAARLRGERTRRSPYASVLFGDTPQETLSARARCARRRLSRRQVRLGPDRARRRARHDAEHFAAAREGLGPDGILLVDAGQIFGDDVERPPSACRRSRRRARPGSRSRSPASALEAYGALAAPQRAR